MAKVDPAEAAKRERAVGDRMSSRPPPEELPEESDGKEPLRLTAKVVSFVGAIGVCYAGYRQMTGHSSWLFVALSVAALGVAMMWIFRAQTTD